MLSLTQKSGSQNHHHHCWSNHCDKNPTYNNRLLWGINKDNASIYLQRKSGSKYPHSSHRHHENHRCQYQALKTLTVTSAIIMKMFRKRIVMHFINQHHNHCTQIEPQQLNNHC